jgi:hypothetical protein
MRRHPAQDEAWNIDRQQQPIADGGCVNEPAYGVVLGGHVIYARRPDRIRLTRIGERRESTEASEENGREVARQERMRPAPTDMVREDDTQAVDDSFKENSDLPHGWSARQERP